MIMKMSTEEILPFTEIELKEIDRLKSTFDKGIIKEFMHDYSVDESQARLALAEMMVCQMKG